LRERGKVLAGTRILVAEDNRINQQVVKEFLHLSGVHVDIANNGVEALQLLEKNHYQAVLMDVHMPEMGGMEATEKIREMDGFDQFPVIALSAGVTQEEREKCTASGMSDFVAKPVNPEELIGVLCYWIGKQQYAIPKLPQLEPVPQQPQTLIPELPGFDLTNVLDMVGGDEALVIQLLCILRDDIPSTAANLETLLTASNLEAATRVVHTIKGSAGNLSAAALHAAAATLESSLRQGILDELAYDGFKQAMHETREILMRLG
jgi:CheY-like chemotaxis protein